MDRPPSTISPLSTSINTPPVAFFSRHPPAVSVVPSAVTYFGRPSSIASPFRWQRSSGTRSETKRGFHKGVKL